MAVGNSELPPQRPAASPNAAVRANGAKSMPFQTVRKGMELPLFATPLPPLASTPPRGRRPQLVEPPDPSAIPTACCERSTRPASQTPLAAPRRPVQQMCMHEIGRESEGSAGGRGNAIRPARPDAGKVQRGRRRGKGRTRRTAQPDQQRMNIVLWQSSMQIERDSFRAALLQTGHHLHDAQRGVEMDIQRRVAHHAALRAAQFRTQRGIQCLPVEQSARERLHDGRFEISCRHGGKTRSRSSWPPKLPPVSA